MCVYYIYIYIYIYIHTYTHHRYRYRGRSHPGERAAAGRRPRRQALGAPGPVH